MPTQSMGHRVAPQINFISDDMSLDQQIDAWRQAYLSLYKNLLKEREKWQVERAQGLALLADYRRDNQQLENEKRQWEQQKEFGFKLVENLRLRVDHYQSKISLIQSIYNIDVDELPTKQGLKTSSKNENEEDSLEIHSSGLNKFGKFANVKIDKKESKVLENKSKLTDDDESSATDMGSESIENEEESDDTEAVSLGLNQKARVILMRQRRESEYLRKEMQALEDEIRQLTEDKQKADERKAKREREKMDKNKKRLKIKQLPKISEKPSDDETDEGEGEGTYTDIENEARSLVQISNAELIEKINEAWEAEVTILLEEIAKREALEMSDEDSHEHTPELSGAPAMTAEAGLNRGVRSEINIEELYGDGTGQDMGAHPRIVKKRASSKILLSEIKKSMHEHMEKKSKEALDKIYAEKGMDTPTSGKMNKKRGSKEFKSDDDWSALNVSVPASSFVLSELTETPSESHIRLPVKALMRRIKEMELEIIELRESKMGLIKATSRELDKMRDVLKTTNPRAGERYKRILDRLFQDDRYTNLMDRLADDHDDSAEDPFDSMLNEMSHLKDRGRHSYRKSVWSAPNGWGLF